jgi:hypothetical protein
MKRVRMIRVVGIHDIFKNFLYFVSQPAGNDNGCVDSDFFPFCKVYSRQGILSFVPLYIL